MTQQLLFRSSYFFREARFSVTNDFFATVIFSEWLFFRVKLLPSSHFLGIESSLGQLLFGIATFLAEELFTIKISTVDLLFRSRINFFRSYNCVLIRSYSEKANFSEKQYSALPIFSGELPFYSGYFVKRRHFS